MIEIKSLRLIGGIIFVLGQIGCSPGHDGDDRIAVSSDDCVVCHEPEYQATAIPPHVGVFPDECALCHTNDSWQPASFAHESVADRLCVLCHKEDYDQVEQPLHVGQFPTTCENCHTYIAWKPALDGVHPEDSFPIAGGAHKGFSCIDCHDVDRGSSVAGANTNCIGCHTGEHSMAKVNEKHREVADYNFDIDTPNFCLVCHPNGKD